MSLSWTNKMPVVIMSCEFQGLSYLIIDNIVSGMATGLLALTQANNPVFMPGDSAYANKTMLLRLVKWPLPSINLQW